LRYEVLVDKHRNRIMLSKAIELFYNKNKLLEKSMYSTIRKRDLSVTMLL
jgi:hypothetical protein